MTDSRADEFESKHMPTSGRLLRREKQVQRYHWVFLVLAAVFAIGTGMALASPMPLAPALATLLPTIVMLFLWVTLSVLRVHLTEQELLVRLGPFGPRIPLDQIETCRTVRRAPGVYRGGGVKLGADGMWTYTYMMSRDHEELVDIVFRDGEKRKRLVMTSEDPAALVRDIEEARASVRQGDRARVDVPAGAEPVATDAEDHDDAEVRSGADRFHG